MTMYFTAVLCTADDGGNQPLATSVNFAGDTLDLAHAQAEDRSMDEVGSEVLILQCVGQSVARLVKPEEVKQSVSTSSMEDILATVEDPERIKIAN